MYQKILVPLDGSVLASDALPHVREMARCMDAQVSLLQVTPEPLHRNDTLNRYAPRGMGVPPRTMNSVNWQLVSEPAQRAEWIEHQVEAAQTYLDAIGDDLAQSGIQAKTLVKPGSVVQTILDAAASEKVDLIVMTTHGRSGVGRFLLGSVADRVVHYAELPVLLVRSKEIEDRQDTDAKPVYQRILVPLDGSALSTAVLNDVREVAQCANAEVLLLRVVPEPHDWPVGEVSFVLSSGLMGMQARTNESDPNGPDQHPEFAETVKARQIEHMREAAQTSLDVAADDLKRAGVRVETMIQMGRPADTILEVADSCHADIIALATQGRSGLTRFLLGSVARQVVENANVPILLVRPQSKSR